MAALALLLGLALLCMAGWYAVRLAGMLVLLACQLAWLGALLVAWPMRALARLRHHDARFLALLLALALPALAHAQPAQPRSWLFLGPHGGYAGRAVESSDGQTARLYGPDGGYVGQWQKEPGGQWMRLGPDGGFVGEAQRRTPASPQ